MPFDPERAEYGISFGVARSALTHYAGIDARSWLGKPVPNIEVTTGAGVLERNHTHHFFQAGQPQVDLEQGVLLQGYHSVGLCPSADPHRGGTRPDHLTDAFVENEHLVYTEAAYVTGVVASRATDRDIHLPLELSDASRLRRIRIFWRSSRLVPASTQPTDEPLGDHRRHA